MAFNENMSEKLDDLFFMKEDQKLIDKLKEMKKFKETKDALAKISGIKNEHILQKLVELNVRPETLTSLSLFPLVEVAWADGNIDKEETKKILAGFEKMGFKKDSSEYEILSQWITHKPSKELLDAWIHYIKGLCEKLSEQEKSDLKNELLTNVRSVAMASGGFFGIGNKISKSEAAVIEILEKAFD